jgi:hypothetical protein
VKRYFIPAFVISASLTASLIPSPAVAEGLPELIAVASVTARPRHPAENIRVESLDLNSDYSIFMERGCPEPVRHSALRRLWSLLPPGAEDGAPWN